MCLVSPIKFFTTDLRGFTRIRKKAYSWDPWESVACLSGFRRGKEIVLREKDGAMARAFDLLAELPDDLEVEHRNERPQKRLRIDPRGTVGERRDDRKQRSLDRRTRNGSRADAGHKQREKSPAGTRVEAAELGKVRMRSFEQLNL
jgi:hypothetical protein